MEKNLLALLIAAAVIVTAPAVAYGSCKNPDWAHWGLGAELTDQYRARFDRYLDEAPILIRATVVETKPTKDKLWSDDSGQFELRARPVEVYRGSVHRWAIRIVYPLRAQKPKMATPMVGEEWVFVLQRIEGDQGHVRGGTCGALGFPVTQKALIKRLSQKLGQGGGAEKQACKEDSDCRAVDCSKYDNPIKSGYRAACVDVRERQVCKCMCFGCH